MATSSGSRAAMLKDLKDRLYDQCWDTKKQMDEGMFRQHDLTGMHIIPGDNADLLMEVVGKLMSEHLLKLVRDASGNAGWICRSTDDAARFKGLDGDQTIVYSLVDEAGSEGMWTKIIKTRSGLHDSTLKQVFKALEAKRLITEFKSVQHSTRKMYIKTNVQPSESATGGPWFTEGELDEEFIEMITKVLFELIKSKSFYKSSGIGTKSRKPKKTVRISGDQDSSHKGKGSSRLAVDELKATRDAALGPIIKLEDAENERATKKQRFDALLPLPAGYQGYPTLDELTRYVDASQVSDTALEQHDIKSLLDVLCWDNRIVATLNRKGETAYRALRRTLEEEDLGPNNALTEAPCGRCPVFDLCEVGGPVGPNNCVYFQQWLDPNRF